MYHIYIGCKTPVKLHLFAQDGPLRLVLFILKKLNFFKKVVDIYKGVCYYIRALMRP